MQILQTKSFKNVVKKLHKNQKYDLDNAINYILENPDIGIEKHGDLVGVKVHKFKMNNQLVLLAYTADEQALTLKALGSHENFYRDMKRD